MAAAASTPDEVLATVALADRLMRDARWREAIDVLTQANGAAPDATIEARLVDVRHRAFDLLDRVGPTDPPPRVTAAGGADGRLPTVDPAGLDVGALRHGLARGGCLLVPGLVPSKIVGELVEGIDLALAAFDAATGEVPGSGIVDPWYHPFTPTPGRSYRVGGRRNWVRAGGALWTADSPRMLFRLLSLLDDLGLHDLAADYFREPPALSANKCTLRRAQADRPGGWHQDGAFLGEDTRALNIWIALTDCGVDAPGMDVLPRRLDHVLEAGTEGAYFDWDVSPDIVEREARDVPVIRPEFNAGDVLLFDHLFLHRTAADSTMTTPRHALETWLFAPSTYPDGQIPMVW